MGSVFRTALISRSVVPPALKPSLSTTSRELASVPQRISLAKDASSRNVLLRWPEHKLQGRAGDSERRNPRSRSAKSDNCRAIAPPWVLVQQAMGSIG